MTFVTARAMSFYGENLATSFDFAERFAGREGHVATMPEIMSLRAATPLNKRVTLPWSDPWRAWYKTTTAEYMGFTAGGVPIIIVAHGIGPMATSGRIKYVYRRREKGYNARQCAISLKQFRQLEAGKFGAVTIVPLEDVTKLDDLAFWHAADIERAEKDKLLQARLGPNWRTVMTRLANQTRAEKLKFAGANPRVVRIEDNNYERQTPDDLPQAHLLSTGQVTQNHQEGEVNLQIAVYLSDSLGANRFVGVRPGWAGTQLHQGPALLDDPAVLKLIVSRGHPTNLRTHFPFIMDTLELVEKYQSR